MPSPITVYTARKIHTMNSSLPAATAVAVRDGMIVEVGDLDTLAPWFEAGDHVLDERFADKVIMPGFIDPHLHPSMAAVILPMHFITAMEWRLPWQNVAPVTSHNAYINRLAEIDGDLQDPDEPLFTWGHHQIWHGRVDRTTLDGISSTRPIIVWQRSFHEISVNSAALSWLGIDEAEADRHPQVDIEGGRFYETGMALAYRGFMPYLLEPARFKGGTIQGVAIDVGKDVYIDLEQEAKRLLLKQ